MQTGFEKKKYILDVTSTCMPVPYWDTKLKIAANEVVT